MMAKASGNSGSPDLRPPRQSSTLPMNEGWSEVRVTICYFGVPSISATSHLISTP
jgi:hypothetical protein